MYGSCIPRENQAISRILQLLFGPNPHPEGRLLNLNIVTRGILYPILHIADKKGLIPHPAKSHLRLNFYPVTQSNVFTLTGA